MINNDPRLQAQADQHPYPLLFATISGAHLYGFPSPDSDFDLRGVHLLPAHELLGLTDPAETVERSGLRDGMELDLVTHDLGKFARLMLRRNGYVLEQLLSPLIVRTNAWHQELVSLVPGCLTRHHAHHYLGFAARQWELFQKEDPPRVKPLLYVFRVLLTGIHLMRTGEIQASLVELQRHYSLGFIPELIDRKLSGPEKGTLPSSELTYFEQEFHRLIKQLEAESEASRLPEVPSGSAALNDFVVRVRLALIRGEKMPGVNV